MKVRLEDAAWLVASAVVVVTLVLVSINGGLTTGASLLLIPFILAACAWYFYLSRRDVHAREDRARAEVEELAEALKEERRLRQQAEDELARLRGHRG